MVEEVATKLVVWAFEYCIAVMTVTVEKRTNDFRKAYLKGIRPLTLRMHYRNPFFSRDWVKKWAFRLVITRGKCQQVLFVLTHYLLLLVNALLF